MKFQNWMKSDNLDFILDKEWTKIKPTTVEFVPTLNCNFSCTQCAYKKAKEETMTKENSDMSQETMEISLQRLKDGGIKNILVTGGGEPLISPLTPQILELSKDMGLTSALYTNGLLLTRKTINRIFEAEPLFVRVSVYGGNQDVMNQYTNTQSSHTHDLVLGKIDKMGEQKEIIGSDLNIGISYLVHPQTADSVLEFGQKMRSLKHIDNIDYIRFTPAVEYFGKEQHSQDMMKKVFDVVTGDITEMFEDSNTEIKPYFHRVNDLHKEKGYEKCLANGWYAELSPTGKLYLCCEKHFLPEYEIGDLTVNTLDEIWQSEKRLKLIEKINEECLSDCPTLCKPHELNKIFNEIKDTPNLRYKVDRAIRQEKIDNRYCPGKLDDFQS